MKATRLVLVVAVLFGGGLLAGAALQHDANASKNDGGGMGPGATPEHALMKTWDGTWDASVDMMGQKSPATETNHVIAGGLWMVSDFKGTFGTMPFEGHMIFGYDTYKKKYVSTWVDSSQTELMLMEGTYDKTTKTLTMKGEGRGWDGKIQPMRETCVDKDANTRIFTMYNTGPDGKEMPSFTITYTRKK